MKSERLRVAAAQIACAAGDVDANLRRHRIAIDDAKTRGVDLLVFPELSLTDYCDAPDCASLARSPTDNEIADLAAMSDGIVASFGFTERREDGAFYNTQALAADGRIVHLHRKANLPHYGALRERDHYRPGSSIAPAQLGDWRIATLICADLWNPALPWLAALQGADALLAPAASSLDAVGDGFDNPKGWDVTLRQIAMTYGLPIVFANHCGARGAFRFWGGSRILDANGEELARAGEGEAIVTATIDRASVAAARVRLPTVRDADPNLIASELARILKERAT